jgi:predicted component of type VI protein secretion system
MVLRIYGLGRLVMKTTVEVADDLYRRAKSEAALRGRKLKDLVEEGLRLVLETRRESRHHRLAELMKRARGTVNSGVSDLASNPEHLKTFGRNASRHR